MLTVAEELPYIKCPLHVVYKLIPKAYGKDKDTLCVIHKCYFIACDIEPHDLNVPAIDTYRPKPKV